MPMSFVARRFAPVIAVPLAFAACSVGSPSAGPSDMTSMRSTSSTVAPVGVTSVPNPVVDEETHAAKQRCVDSSQILDRRIEEEGFEYPDEDIEELSEEELEQILHPPVEYVDGVAAPGERPLLTPMVPFDPNTAPIPELDLLVGNCVESGVVTEAELHGEDDEEDSDEEWCAELAGIPVEEVRVFATEEGEDVVREEFEYCGLPNPLD